MDIYLFLLIVSLVLGNGGGFPEDIPFWPSEYIVPATDCLVYDDLSYKCEGILSVNPHYGNEDTEPFPDYHPPQSNNL